MAEKLMNAGMNTLVGLTVVFAVLILIAWIISLLKYTYKLEAFVAERRRKKEEKKRLKALKKQQGKTQSEELVDKTFEQIVQKEELSDGVSDEASSDMSDNMEIVAVITAAICAATGCSSDSFVVRSVRKVRKKG